MIEYFFAGLFGLASLFGSFTPSTPLPGTAPSVLKVVQGGTGAATFTTGECLKGNGTGPITTGSCGGGSSAGYPFTVTTNFGQLAVSTSTAVWFKASPYSFFASSTAQLSNSTTTLASVGILWAPTITAQNDTGVNISAGTSVAGATGKDITLLAANAKSGGGGNGGDIRLLVGTGDGAGTSGFFRFFNDGGTRSGILDFSLISASDKTFTFPNTTGTICLTTTCATSAIGDPFTHPAAGFSATTTTLTLANASSTKLSAYRAWFGGAATSTFDINGVPSFPLTGLLQGNGAGTNVTAITDSSTVGQVLRVTGASAYGWGALNLANSSAITGDLPFANLAQVSANSVLGNITGSTADAASIATSSLFAGTNGQVLARVGGTWIGVATTTFSSGLTYLNGNVTVDQTANFAWTGAHDLGDATSLEIPNGTGPTVDAIGEIALDTTDNQLLIGTSTNASFPAVLRTIQPLFRFRVASTSSPFFAGGFVTGKTIGLPTDIDGFTVVNVTCSVWNGTSIVLKLNGTTAGDTNTFTCSGATSTNAITANGTYTASEGVGLITSTVTGVPDYLYIAIFGKPTRE